MSIELIHSETAFEAGPEGRFFKIEKRTFREEEGETRDQYIWVRGKFVSTVCQTRDGLFLILEQFKYGAFRSILTLPAGGVKQSESPVQAAQRELLEETGYQSASWHYLNEVWDPDLPDKSTGTHSYFFCRDAVLGRLPEVGESILSLLLVSESEMLQMVRTGRLLGQPSKSAILHYLLNKDRLL